MSARESPTRPIVCAADLTAVLSDTPAAVFKSRWQFNNKRGAILLMHRPRLFCVPEGVLR
jgi:hypothetical protein